MHNVILEAKVKLEYIDEMKQFLNVILNDTRAYEGCTQVDVLESCECLGHLLFYQLWESKDQYDKYCLWRDQTDFMSKIIPMMESPFKIRHYIRIPI